jgi:hypothetical protein
MSQLAPYDAYRVGIDPLPEGLDLTAIGHSVLNAGEVLVHDNEADTWSVVTQAEFDGPDGYEWV